MGTNHRDKEIESWAVKRPKFGAKLIFRVYPFSINKLPER